MKNPLDKDAEYYMNVAKTASEYLFVQSTVLASWSDPSFLRDLFNSSGNPLRRRFDDGVSTQRLVKLVGEGKVTVEVHRFPRTQENDKRLRFFRGGGSKEHSQLKLSTFCWLVDHFKPVKGSIETERSRTHGIPDLFLRHDNGIWVECGDTETRKVLNVLLAGHSCLLAPFSYCEPIGGIMLRVVPFELAALQAERDKDLWTDE